MPALTHRRPTRPLAAVLCRARSLFIELLRILSYLQSGGDR